jgi:Na+/H+ antiporter NhaC
VAGYNPFTALLSTVDRYLRGELSDPDNASILIFSLLLGGMVGILTRMGSARAIVNALTPVATSRRRGLMATWAAGLAIFFDDYANTLIVGNTMRPLTDRLKISREKLAYIVDSTAAPVAAIAFVSTWVGAEIGYIKEGMEQADAISMIPAKVSAFGVFLGSVPYLFYPILALLVVVVLNLTGRDFGPMLAAERRALGGGGVLRPGSQLSESADDLKEPEEGQIEPGWWTGAIPIGIVVVTVITGVIYTGVRKIPEGGEYSVMEIFGHADPFSPLLWGTLMGCITAMFFSVTVTRIPLQETISAWLGGFRSMLMAVVILLLAWSLGAVTQSLGTASFLSAVLSDRLPVELLPLSVFLVASVISFATGTSWGTMAILFPLVVPLSISMGAAEDPSQPAAYHILLASVAGVMAGSLFGDHCSPISDTTVLSSMASRCDHVDHVRTQLPYALTVAVVAAVFGATPSGFGVNPWICLGAGGVTLFAIVRLVGKPVEGGAS